MEDDHRFRWETRHRMGFCLAVAIAMLALMVSGCTTTQVERGLDQAAPKSGGMDAAGVIGEEYRLGPEDVLEITVQGEDKLKTRALVDLNGWIAFPMVGQVRAAGRTASEVERELTDKLKDQLLDPVVTVSLAVAAGYRIYVVGKVSAPGQFVGGRRIDVLQALALAGGLTPFADQDAIKILRRGGAEGEGDRVFPFQYSALKRGEKLEQNIVLQSGDVVMVP